MKKYDSYLHVASDDNTSAPYISRFNNVEYCDEVIGQCDFLMQARERV